MINYFRLQLNKYIPRIFSVHVHYRCKITFTEQSTKFVKICTACIKMIDAVWKLIIFTSMVNRIINISGNERVTLQIYDMCLQMFDVCTLRHKAHIEAIVQFLPYPDQQVRCDGLHSRGNSFLQIRYAHVLQWHKHFVLHRWIVDGMPDEQKQLIHASQIAAHKTLSAPESPLSLCYVRDQERRGEWDCACAQNLNTCCFVPCGKLSNACVFKAVMAEWNRSIHFDTPCIC